MSLDIEHGDRPSPSGDRPPEHNPGWYHTMETAWATRWFGFPEPLSTTAPVSAWDGSTWAYVPSGVGFWELCSYPPDEPNLTNPEGWLTIAGALQTYNARLSGKSYNDVDQKPVCYPDSIRLVAKGEIKAIAEAERVAREKAAKAEAELAQALADAREELTKLDLALKPTDADAIVKTMVQFRQDGQA